MAKPMRVGLFVPCYIDAFFPEVGIATLELLERFDLAVDYPFNQTCCGQPMANSGCHAEAAATERLFVENFSGYDYVVCPSGSCVNHVRSKFTAIDQTDAVVAVRGRTFELVEFLHDILKVGVSLGFVPPQGRPPQRMRLAARLGPRLGLRAARARLLQAARSPAHGR